MNTVICPYSLKSKSARILSKLTRVPLIRGTNLNKINTPTKVIFWGTPQEYTIFNENLVTTYNFDRKRMALDKQKFNSALNSSYRPILFKIPENLDYLKHSINSKLVSFNNGAICYKYSQSHGGKGVSFLSKDEFLDHINSGTLNTKLVSSYVPRIAELRVHVYNKTSINNYSSHNLLIHQKRLKNNTKKETHTYKVRSHDNGWIFSNNVDPRAHEVIVGFLESREFENILDRIGLHFGAFDILITKGGGIRVLEVNTAPGLERGDTLEFYVNLIKHIKEPKITNYGLSPCTTSVNIGGEWGGSNPYIIPGQV